MSSLPAGMPRRRSRTCRYGCDGRLQAQLVVQADEEAGPVEGPPAACPTAGQPSMDVSAMSAATGRRQVHPAPMPGGFKAPPQADQVVWGYQVTVSAARRPRSAAGCNQGAHRRLQLRAGGRQQGQGAEGPVQRLFVRHPGPLHPHAQHRALCSSCIMHPVSSSVSPGSTSAAHDAARPGFDAAWDSTLWVLGVGSSQRILYAALASGSQGAHRR